LALDDLLPLFDENNAFNGTDVARIGFDDLGLLANQDDGGTWPEPPFYAHPGNPEFDDVTRISPFIAVYSELYLSDQGGQIDGKRAIRRSRLHHFSSLSNRVILTINHSYIPLKEIFYSRD